MRELQFDPEYLASLPENIREQVTSPEFAAQVQKERRTGRRESKRGLISFIPAPNAEERALLRLQRKLMLISEA